MRVISGSLKGRIINIPRGIRPTQDKVREALFDILGDIRGLLFLDLYAGSGAIGLEALSHGADKVVFVETQRQCIKTIRENISLISTVAQQDGNPANYDIMWVDVDRALRKLSRRGEKFDIIFLDPPYYQDLSKKTLKSVSSCDILSPNGLIICQHFKRDNLADKIENLKLIKQARYGDTILSFYKRDEPGESGLTN